MPKFQYKAVNMGGRAVDGIFEGPDRASVAGMLRAKAFYPLEITELKTAVSLNRELGKKIPIRALSLFCQQFSTILSSGISMGQALDILAQQTEEKRLKAVLVDVYEKVQTGRSLTDAFSEHAQRFPNVFLSTISVGEVSGTMEASLKRLYGYFKQEHFLVSKFRTAMIYPVIVFSLAVVITVVMLVAVVPTFQGVFASFGRELPGPTQLLLSVSNFLRTQYPILLIVLGIIGILIRLYIKSEDGRLSLDRLKLRLPVFGKLAVKLMVARFTRTLGAMTASGVPLTQALEITSRVISNKHIEQKLKKVTEAVQQGSTLHKPLAEISELPPMVQNMTRLGEESGTLEYMLEQTAVYYDAETETAIARTTAVVEPVIIIIMAIVILCVIIPILLPTLQMSTLVR